MTVLGDQLANVLMPGMFIPDALSRVFSWIEDNGTFLESDGRRIGLLFSEDRLRDEWSETERPGGTVIEFFAEGNANLSYWFGHNRPEVLNRVCVFARTGAEGSMAAFWLDEEGKQRIVHLGSGSGSVLCCVLADDPIDFIRLLAIGYDEVCWNTEYSEPPNADWSEGDLFVHPNTNFQDWVKNTFSVAIPRTAKEIVEHPAEIGDIDSPDPFCRWVEKNVA